MCSLIILYTYGTYILCLFCYLVELWCDSAIEYTYKTLRYLNTPRRAVSIKFPLKLVIEDFFGAVPPKTLVQVYQAGDTFTLCVQTTWSNQKNIYYVIIDYKYTKLILAMVDAKSFQTPSLAKCDINS